MTKDYKHIEAGKEIRFISGFYEVEEEKRVKFKDGEVLVIIGHAIVDSACCGMGGCRYALVPGKIKKFRYKRDEDGKEWTEVEVLTDEEKREIEKILKNSEVITQVIFW